MRIRYVLLLCIAVAMGGVAPLSAQAAATGVPLLNCSGLPCVDITVAGGKHLKMLIDTGNANSVLDRAIAEGMGINLQPVNGPDGKPYPGYASGTVTHVRVGDEELGDLEMLVVKLQPSIDKGNMPAADGTLAYTAFKDRALTIDYKNHRVNVSGVLKVDASCPQSCGTITNPTFGKQGPPIVVTTGFRLNGKPLTMQIDTLYEGTMLIYPTSVDKLGLTAQQNTSKTRMFAFTDGGVPMKESTASKESFENELLRRNATLYFATPKVHLPDGMFDGTVGNELFLGHVLTLDFHANRFWMS
jgi:Aspartyl protease